jgi:hypothetical protein
MDADRGITIPVMAFNRVVLPAPLGPIRLKSSPGSTERLTLSRAVSPPNFTVTDSTERIGLIFLLPFFF